MRSRGVVLIASRISVPSPATPCTLITQNGVPHGPISRICFVPFTGANAGACLRMVPRRDLSTLHLVSHTDALYTKSPLGRLHGPVAHIGRMRLSSVQHAPPTHYQPQCGHGADCPARCLATLKSCQQEQASSCCGCSDARMAAWQLEEGRNIEMTGCTSEAAAQHH